MGEELENTESLARDRVDDAHAALVPPAWDVQSPLS
jgi:hypothetical protein